jgi:hypothetical protein
MGRGEGEKVFIFFGFRKGKEVWSGRGCGAEDFSVVFCF